jgi:epoxyqueuosine reductase
VLYDTAKFIEDNGYEGIVYRNTGGRSALSDMTGIAAREESPELHRHAKKGGTNSSPNIRGLLARSVSPNLPAPDVFIHFRIAAYLCGLGEIGYSKMLLSPEFGPMNRQAFILTDAELETDPIYNGPQLCNNCMACVSACPGSCLSATEQVKVELAGHEVSWGKLDEWKCFAYYIGASKASNPFLPRDAFKDIPGGAELMRGSPDAKVTAGSYSPVNDAINRHYPAEPGGYNPPKCGGCLRACLNSLEKRGVLNRKSNQNFRAGKAWKLEV